MKPRSEQDMCKDCGGFCCHSKFFGMDQDRKDSDVWNYMIERSTGWIEYGDKKKRWFILNEPCSKFKDGKCLIYEQRPEICKGWPYKDDADVWQIKCEVLRNRRIKWQDLIS